MTEKVFVRPREGLIVPDPDRHDTLPPGGRLVPLDAFWKRRLNDGDVVLSTETKKKESKDGR